MATLTTGLSSYRTLHEIADTVDTDLAAASTFIIGKPSGAIDLHTLDGAGKHLKVNSISMIAYATATANGEVVVSRVYGAAENGPPQLIANISWTIGTARPIAATSTTLWADTATVTSSHMRTITVADGGGSDRVCSVTLDLTGYRYILGLWITDANDTDSIVCLYRTF